MKAIFPSFLLFLTVLCANLTYAQTTFTVSDTVQNVYKNTTFGTVHGYVQLTNQTQNNLNLRWKLSITGKYPPSWVFSAADPDTNYNPVFSGDSADFTLDLVSTTTNKIIYGLDHKGEPGSAQMHFYIFDPANPAENVTVHFNLYILDATGIPSHLYNDYFEIKNNTIYIKNAKNIKAIRIISLNGALIYKEEISENKHIELPDKSSIYIIEIITTDNQKNSIKLINQ